MRIDLRRKAFRLRDVLGPCIVGGILLGAVGASAFQITKTAFSGGAVVGQGGTFELRGTVAEAGVIGSVAGGSFLLREGFWPPVYFLNATGVPPVSAQSLHYANALHQSYPNPFQNRAMVTFSVAQPSQVKLSIYDVTGRLVTNLINDHHVPGRYEAAWSGRDRRGHTVASGVYFYRLDIGSWARTKRMLKLR
jgi:hypothetical protein